MQPLDAMNPKLSQLSLGIIPDGNRRWAKQYGLSADVGHTVGLAKLHYIIEELLPQVGHLYVYLLAWHNWERDKAELTHLTSVEAPIIRKFMNYPKITFQHGHPPRQIGKPIDFIVRSMPGSSELSGFFPEESKDAKVVVLNKYWPDVTTKDILDAIS